MIDTALARFVIDVKVLQVVVKVDGARAQVTTEQSRVGREHGRDVDVSLTAQGDRETCLPFVEVRDDCLVKLPRDVLGEEALANASIRNRQPAIG